MKYDAQTCDAMMDTFFSLDKNERLPMKLALHLLTCKKCRTQVRLCTLAEKVCASPLYRLADESAVAALMERLSEFFPMKRELGRMSMRRWIVSGIIMIMAMMLFGILSPITTPLQINLVFYLVFAGTVSVYCALFIGSNMDFFVKKIETEARALLQ